MRTLGRLAVLGALASAGLATLLTPAAATPKSTWMTEAAMRTAFIGRTLDGHYINGLRWTETYAAEGRLDYRESERRGLGYWYFRSAVFCTFYDPGYGLSGGCWTALKVSANCYEFYAAGVGDTQPEDGATPGPLDGWAARAWRRGEPSTCEEKPSA
ncbi:MAG: hypothetical protein K2X43_10110 [Hyphomonadaceae bacterium]|nr:hypothetical protein [Hyphomonadaceae bacterium]